VVCYDQEVAQRLGENLSRLLHQSRYYTSMGVSQVGDLAQFVVAVVVGVMALLYSPSD